MSTEDNRGWSVLRDVGVYGFGNALSNLAGFVCLLILSRAFAPTKYGLLATMGAVSMLLDVFMVLGADSALVRHHFDTTSHAERRKLTTTYIGSIAAWSILLCAALVPLAWPASQWLTRSGRAVTPILLVLAMGPIVVTNRLLGQALRNQFRPVAFISSDVASALLDFAFSLIAALALHLGVSGVLLGTLVAEFIVLPVRVYFVRDLLRWPPSRRLLRPMIAYGAPLVPASLAYWVYQASDRFILARITSLAQVGLYGYAILLMGIGAVISTSIGMAWIPHAVESATQDRERAAKQFGRMLTYLLIGSGAIAVWITALARPLVLVLGGHAYAGSAIAIGPLALAFVAMLSSQVTTVGISISKKNRYIAQYAAYAAVVNIALCIVLVRLLGMVGAAWATTAAYLVMTLCSLWRSQRLWPIVYERRRSAIAAILTVAFVLVAIQTDRSPWHTSLGAVAVILALCIGFPAVVLVTRTVDGRDVALLRRYLAATVLGRRRTKPPA